ncbi:NPCBM/NEW2 domain-containing protein [Haloarcula amylovorans]|uniref:NPCBM/NEW2 domain-containing protein n=1 Tax=Haloarcula amylovorans TaxID=2562280 RepID=UPI0014309ABC|nr:NPCBM/NEW2 domain-containing protein [Halomicroarcula amylolytica]
MDEQNTVTNDSASDSRPTDRGISRRDVLRGTSALGVAGMASRLPVGRAQAAPDDTTFVSVPDMYNWDIANPQSGWEDAIDWFFTQLTSVEGAEFALSAGDIMDARWWTDKQQVQTRADEYWGGYKQRFEDSNLPVYVAPGDHERGDNDWPDWKLDLVPTFEQKFVEIFDHPTNGPAGKEELAYYFVKDNALFVTVDTWELKNGEAHLSVTGDQLTWFENILSNHQDKDFIIVQGHVPVISGVNTRNSSGLYLEGGQSSEFWQVMKQYGVDAYLCGEHHAITTDKVDGIWQIVHGSLWGTHTNLNYLVGTVGSDTLELELKEFDVNYGGGYIDHINRSDTNAPRETVTISDSSKQNGPTTVESITIDNSTSDDPSGGGCPVFKTTPDQTGNGNDGALEGAVSQVSGKDGKGIEFNGGYISVEESSSLDVQQPPFTVECWVKPTDPNAGGNGYEPYVTKVGETGQYSLHRTSLDNEANGQLEFAVNSGGEFYTPRAPVPDDWQGTWHHLAGVYDGSAVKLYVDGTEKDSVSLSSPLTATTSPVEIGRNFGNPTRKLTAGTVIDRVRIHRAGLTASELDQSDPAGSANPVLWFDFESINTDATGAPTSDTYLSDIEAIDFTVGYTFDDFGRNEAVTGNPLQVDGQTYDKGIGTHATSEIRYCLDQKVARFTAMVGMDEKGGEFTGGAAGGNGVVFRVLGDGQILAEKGPVTHDMGTMSVDVDVSDVSVLSLVADGNGDTSYDHADWIEAQVTTQTIPEAIAGADGTITLSEIQIAIDWWSAGDPVPGTGGETIGFNEMLELIDLWATGESVNSDSGTTSQSLELTGYGGN